MKPSSLAVVLIFLIVVGCVRHGSGDKPVLAVSTEPQRWLLEQIAGDAFEVKSLMDGSTDAENFDPSIATLRMVESSMAYFKMGHDAFEKDVVGRLSGKVAVIDCSAGIDLIYGTHSHSHADEGHIHSDEEAADPHLLSSVRNARIMARNMADALCRLDPAAAKTYRDNLRSLTARLDSIDSVMTARLDNIRDKAFVVWHPSLTYLARDYGLRQVSLGVEGKEMTPLALAAALDSARSSGARIMFVQPDDNNGRSRQISAQAGVKAVEINTQAVDWLLQIPRLASAMGASDSKNK